MKANELMTGDWVLYGGKPHPVLQLDRGADYKTINPLPLTVDILAKNGFREYNDCGYKGNKGYICNGFYLNADFTIRFALIERKLNYVHELQHALRLVGLDNVADNFKV